MSKEKGTYIGIVYWATDPDTVMDNTAEGTLKQVWRALCLAHPLHAGNMSICKARYDGDGDVVGERVKEFCGVDECRDAYQKTFKAKAPKRGNNG